jgi:hypothetical protein
MVALCRFPLRSLHVLPAGLVGASRGQRQCGPRNEGGGPGAEGEDGRPKEAAQNDVRRPEVLEELPADLRAIGEADKGAVGVRPALDDRNGRDAGRVAYVTEEKRVFRRSIQGFWRRRAGQVRLQKTCRTAPSGGSACADSRVAGMGTRSSHSPAIIHRRRRCISVSPRSTAPSTARLSPAWRVPGNPLRGSAGRSACAAQ